MLRAMIFVAGIAAFLPFPALADPAVNVNAAASPAPIGTTAALIAPARKPSVAGRFAITIINKGLVDLYIGAAGVTAASGFPIEPGGALTLNTQAAIYGITASSTDSVRYVETY